MTRREWLKVNPPPKAAGALRDLVGQLSVELDARALVESNRKTWQQHVTFWTQEIQRAQAVADTVKLQHANSQLADANGKISDADKQLAASADVPKRIADLQRELTGAARCPTHQKDLHRHKNRPEDLFLCDVGPHFFLWTKASINNPAGALVPWEMSTAIPDLDTAMEWI